MFSLQPYDELDVASPTTTHHQAFQIPHHSLSEPNLISFSATHTAVASPRRRPSQADGFNHRRHMHRDVERRRREEMSKLYASLRALLPLHHCTKGRSSVCDQIEEAEKYIKEMHSKIQELRARRVKLKKLDMATSSSNEGGDKCVAINEVMDGVEILISNKTPEFELSRVLAELLERELHVVSCVSTRTNGGFLHKLQIQGRDMMSLDVSELHDRLADAIDS